MLISLCRKFILIMLFVQHINSFLQNEDEDRIIDVDDLMRLQQDNQISDKIKSPLYQIKNRYNFRRMADSLEDLNLEENKLEKNNYNDKNIIFSNLIDEQKHKIPGPLIDENKVSMLEDLILHPTWLTVNEERLKTKAISNNNQKTKEQSEIERYRRLQDVVRSKLFNGGNRLNKLLSNSKYAQPRVESIEKSNEILSTEIPANYLVNSDPDMLNFNFEHENSLVVKTLNDFYKKLFETLSETIPSLKFEDPFLFDFENKPRSISNNKTRNDVGNYIDKKLEILKKQADNRFPDISLSKILEKFPNLLSRQKNFKKITGENKEKTDDRLSAEKTAGQIKNSALLIPQIRYSYEVIKPAPSNYSVGNVTVTPNLWYYSNFYNTELPVIIKNSSNASLSAVQTNSTTIQNELSVNKLKEELEKQYKKLTPQLNNFLKSSNMGKRLEWEPIYEMEDSSENLIPLIEIHPSTGRAYNHVTTSTSLGESNISGDPFWIKNPGRMMEFLFAKNRNQNNRYIVKNEGKLHQNRNSQLYGNKGYTILDESHPNKRIIKLVNPLKHMNLE